MAASDADDAYLLEHAPCGLFSTLKDGTITTVNATLLSWLQTTREKVVGTRLQDWLTMPGRIFHDTHYMPLLAMQGVAREIAFDLHRPGASNLSVMVTTIGDRDEHGELVRFRSAVFEASSRRSYEQELVRQRHAAQQEATARAALLAMISHDVRSPLSAILMATDLLGGESRYVQTIRTSARSILDLVNAILDHSRLEAGAAAWDPQPTDLRSLVSEIASIHSVSAEAKGLELRTSVDSRIPETVMVDRFKLGQIVTNLVSNALKFTERGQVSLDLKAQEVAETETVVEVRVTDTGIGIPQEKQKIIFNEFQQASASTSRRYGGAGLGLAISRKLAALVGSSLQVESTVGSGTSFWCVLRLPLPPRVTKVALGNR